MNHLDSCPRCGATVDPGEPCAACLITAAMTPPEAPDLAGSRLGPYEIGRVLGQGGMGVVYEAVDTRPTSCRYGRTVALKILAADLDVPEQLVREAQLLGKLEHDHIVPVYEAGEHEGIAYFTMKLVDGGRLVAPAADARRAAEIALAIARAVELAHRHGVLHRDLKPANVLVDSTGRAFVTDFGLAAHEALMAGAAPGGTPQYMAPEVWRGEPGASSTAADVWGAGTILYELLTGQPPFKSSSREELERRVTTEAPLPLTGVHPDLAAVCLHCLKKDPAQRYATAGELAADLTRFLAGEHVAVNPPSRGARWLRRAARHPVITALSALLFLAALHAVVSEVSLVHAREVTLRSAAVTARSLARLTALQFDRHRAVVEAAGADPRFQLALADPTSSKSSEECARLLAETRRLNYPFSTWFLLDATGTMIGRAPVATHDTQGRSFRFRDYFRGAAEHEEKHLRTAYVSLAHQSEGDDDYQIAISIAIHDSADHWIGLLAATLPTGAAFGSIELEDPSDESFTAALLAPRGPERNETTIRPDLVFLQQRTLGRGEALSAGMSNVLSSGSESSGLVRLVPVRGTPFSVLVHVAYDGALGGPSTSLRR